MFLSKNDHFDADGSLIFVKVSEKVEKLQKKMNIVCSIFGKKVSHGEFLVGIGGRGAFTVHPLQGVCTIAFVMKKDCVNVLSNFLLSFAPLYQSHCVFDEFDKSPPPWAPVNGRFFCGRAFGVVLSFPLDSLIVPPF